MQILAIIPARGGSKGIPKKNIRLLNGEPLIAYTIKSARKSKYITRIIVSTDDPEIAAVSQQYDAEIIWRPVEISGDDATSESALLHSMEYLKQKEGYCPDLIVFLQCTSPLALAEDIDQTIEILLNTSADCAFSATKFYKFLWGLGQDGIAHSINHNYKIRVCRQKIAFQYCENGAIYVMRTVGFIKAGHRFFGNISIFCMPLERSIEIDEPIDVIIAESLISSKLMIVSKD